MTESKTATLLGRIERWVAITAVGLAVGAWFYDHEAFWCVLATGLFMALNFRLWRVFAAWSRYVPGVLYLALLLKVPVLAAGIYLLLQIGKPWMVALGASSLLIAMLLSINPKHWQDGERR
ncbi:MAG: hypothetical protein NZT92_16955 [Abditibacteriales bacterium]|nr:hypothetical protein [Abditibacteriales bacterium]